MPYLVQSRCTRIARKDCTKYWILTLILNIPSKIPSPRSSWSLICIYKYMYVYIYIDIDGCLKFDWTGWGKFPLLWLACGFNLWGQKLLVLGQTWQTYFCAPQRFHLHCWIWRSARQERKLLVIIDLLFANHCFESNFETFWIVLQGSAWNIFWQSNWRRQGLRLQGHGTPVLNTYIFLSWLLREKGTVVTRLGL